MEEDEEKTRKRRARRHYADEDLFDVPPSRRFKDENCLYTLYNVSLKLADGRGVDLLQMSKTESSMWLEGSLPAFHVSAGKRKGMHIREDVSTLRLSMRAQARTWSLDYKGEYVVRHWLETSRGWFEITSCAPEWARYYRTGKVVGDIVASIIDHPALQRPASTPIILHDLTRRLSLSRPFAIKLLKQYSAFIIDQMANLNLDQTCFCRSLAKGELVPHVKTDMDAQANTQRKLNALNTYYHIPRPWQSKCSFVCPYAECGKVISDVFSQNIDEAIREHYALHDSGILNKLQSLNDQVSLGMQAQNTVTELQLLQTEWYLDKLQKKIARQFAQISFAVRPNVAYTQHANTNLKTEDNPPSILYTKAKKHVDDHITLEATIREDDEQWVAASVDAKVNVKRLPLLSSQSQLPWSDTKVPVSQRTTSTLTDDDNVLFRAVAETIKSGNFNRRTQHGILETLRLRYPVLVHSDEMRRQVLMMLRRMNCFVQTQPNPPNGQCYWTYDDRDTRRVSNTSPSSLERAHLKKIPPVLPLPPATLSFTGTRDNIYTTVKQESTPATIESTKKRYSEISLDDLPKFLKKRKRGQPATTAAVAATTVVVAATAAVAERAAERASAVHTEKASAVHAELTKHYMSHLPLPHQDLDVSMVSDGLFSPPTAIETHTRHHFSFATTTMEKPVTNYKSDQGSPALAFRKKASLIYNWFSSKTANNNITNERNDNLTKSSLKLPKQSTALPQLGFSTFFANVDFGLGSSAVENPDIESLPTKTTNHFPDASETVDLTFDDEQGGQEEKNNDQATAEYDVNRINEDEQLLLDELGIDENGEFKDDTMPNHATTSGKTNNNDMMLSIATFGMQPLFHLDSKKSAEIVIIDDSDDSN